jgi:4-hydroxy-3-methylbut-2-enyl diphosphate reductase
MDVKFLQGKIGGKDYSVVNEGDVVILPAFGATIQEMNYLDQK